MMKKRWRRTLRLIPLAVILFFAGSGAVLLWAASLKTPDLSSFEEGRKISQSTKIYDRTGEVLLYDLHQDVQRTLVSFDQISRHLKNATVAIEDAEFYEHRGVKPTAILRAAISNFLITLHLQSGYTQGGSTITQQVIKKTLLVDDRNLSRKLKEWVLALKLERVMTKEQILTVYLNEIPYGGNMYGIEEAAQNYFDKAAADLTLAESAYLAALPQAPSFYSPHGSHTDALENRKNLVLEKMLENGFITKEEYDDARAQTVVFQPPRKNGIIGPHFVFYVRDYLEEKYGRDALDERGFRVITTLDVALQEKGEQIVEQYALENTEKFNAHNAGLVAVDPQTGQILAMVGSRDYFGAATPEGCSSGINCRFDPFVNTALRARQPGSSFKPFVYATALGKGYTPDTVVFDVETQFSTACAADNFTSDGECYSPGNYDNIFRGPVTLRNALAQSINVPAVKVLYLAGLGDSLRTAQSMGISTLADTGRYGLTLVLGGGEVTLLEMTSAYGVFATLGIRNPPTGILRIEDVAGNLVEEYTPRPERVLSESVAKQINDILSDNAARTPAFGEDSYLRFPGRDVAAKTGTTNDYRDAWVIGYTPNLAVGAWAGNNDNSPMEKKVAGFIIAPLWHAFLESALPSFEELSFVRPDYNYEASLPPIVRGIWQGGQTYTIDRLSGKLVTEFTPEVLREERPVISVHSILHWIDKSNPLLPRSQSPETDGQYRLWEPPVRAWALQNGYLDQDPTLVIPVATDDIHTPSNLPRITILSPANNAKLKRATQATIQVATGGSFAPVRVDYYINDLFLGSSSRAPFSFSFKPEAIATIATTNTLTAIVTDAAQQQTTVRATFLVVD